MSDNESATTSVLSMEEEVTTSKVKGHKKMILSVLLVTLLLLLAIILGVLIIMAHISANATRESIKLKTMTALKTAPNGTTLGRPIWLKISNASCLLFSNSEGHFYATKTSNLDYCLDIGQRWAMDERGLYYWEDVWGGKQEDFCQIKRGSSHLCYRKSPIRFTITEHRVDFKQKKVFFTIQSLAEPGLCLTLCPLCPTKNIKLVSLDHCNRSPEQFFSLKIDYEENFASLQYSSLVHFFGL